MGNASFWVQSILTNQIILPTQDDFINEDSVRLQLGPLVWDKKDRCFRHPEEIKKYFDDLRSLYDSDPLKHSCDDFFRDLASEEFHKKKEHHKLKFEHNFSYDVVFSLDKLAEGLGLGEKEPRDMIQGIVEEKLGIYTKSDWAKREFFNHWIIFNAREQKLQIVYGIKAEDLRMLIGGQKPIDQLTDPAQRDARAHIINAFSMMNADGSEPHSVDFHSFRGAFTPEFYPRRFALKDSIYAQRLDLLAYLLRHVLRRYATCSPPVKYCEFSVGCGDLSRPWVLDVLSTFSQAKHLSGTFKTLVDMDYFPWLKTTGFEKSVDYRFLVGFNRQISPISNAYTDKEAIKFLFEVPHCAIHVMLKEFYLSDRQKPTLIFTKQVQQLLKMKEENDANPHFFDWIVGLDSCGDELGHPYCPFLAYEFIKFVNDARKRNSNFGVRIHAAENVPFIRPELPGYRLFAAHMYILYRCIDFLKKKLKLHIRVGHGVAFDKLLSIKNYKYRKSSVLVAEMQRNAKSVFSSIPFEVNITSNFYLLGDAIRNVEKKKPLSYLYDIGVPVVLSTDNDGIWPIDKCALGHQSHHSLGAEYCRAITTRFITKEDQLENMIKDSKRFCFDKIKELVRLNESNTSVNEDYRESHYSPTDVLAHPIVLDMLFRKEGSSTGSSNSCLQYYKSIYESKAFSKTEEGANDEKNYIEVMMHILVACFYLTRSFPYKNFEAEDKELFSSSSLPKDEYQELFSSSGCEKIYSACENVYMQLMNDTSGEGASMEVSVDEKDYLFCSEIPDNRESAPDFLLATIENFIRKCTKPATIFSFLSNTDLNSPKIMKILKNIDKKIEEREIKICIHTNTGKHLSFPSHTSGKLFINSKPEQRTDAAQEEIECILLYAVCPHGSVATSALHFIAKHIHKKSFHIEPQYVNFHSLFIPFLPLQLGYPVDPNQNETRDIKEPFLELHSLSPTKLAEKILIEKHSICKSKYDPKYNLLCADVKYAKQVETKDLLEVEELIETITKNEDKFLEILYILCKSLSNFNMRPRLFVILENINEYDLYKKEFENYDKIAAPIIQIEKKFLICSSATFFEKNSEPPERLLFSLAVGWNPPLNYGNSPYEYPYSKWVKSILKVDREKLNQQLGQDTWESFLTTILLDASERAWYSYTVGNWCDMIEDAFSREGNRKSFMHFLKKTNKHEDFKIMLNDSNRHKIGNRWQKEVIEKHKANKHLQEICKYLDDTSQN